MDISPEYIKMCQQAEEIQTRTLGEEDYCVVIDGNKRVIYQGLLGFHKDPFLSPTPVRVIWLPRQDQLQEMLRGQTLRYPQLAIAFSKWLDDSGYLEVIPGVGNFPEAISCPFGSMEQLWLAFTMHEKYHKRWSGTDWIKEE